MMLTTRSRQVTEIVRGRAAAQAEQRAMMRTKIAPHNPLAKVLVDGAWHDEPCFIVAGGPSLIGFDFERLRGRGRVIAINRSFEFIPFADVLFFMDWKFYRRCHDRPDIHEKWKAFSGHKTFLNLMGRRLDDCYSVRSLGRNGVSGSLARGLYHGNNSGIGALNLALCLRAKPIYLLGYDMRHDGGKSHFHDGYGPRQSERTVKSFLHEFDRMAPRLRANGRIIDIVNLNPRSGLRVFKFGDIDEVLKDGTTGQGMGGNVTAPRAVELQPASA